MPWGKFKGREIYELPTWYIKWLATECYNEEIMAEADDELQFRKHHNIPKDKYDECPEAD